VRKSLAKGRRVDVLHDDRLPGMLRLGPTTGARSTSTAADTERNHHVRYDSAAAAH